MWRGPGACAEVLHPLSCTSCQDAHCHGDSRAVQCDLIVEASLASSHCQGWGRGGSPCRVAFFFVSCFFIRGSVFSANYRRLASNCPRLLPTTAHSPSTAVGLPSTAVDWGQPLPSPSRLERCQLC